MTSNDPHIEVVIVREKRRNITLQAKPALLLVKAPIQASEADITEFIARNEPWIRKSCIAIDDHLFLLGTPVDWSMPTHGPFPLPTQTPPQARARIHKTLCHKAITDQFDVTTRRLNVAGIPLRICAMASSWGKCHSSGRLEIHWQTGTLPPHLIDYIVCHEIAHRTHFDHSQNFWAHLDSLHAGARKHDRELKKWPLR